MKRTIFYLLGWAIIALLFTANYYLFDRFMELNYYQWFIEQGAFISIITGLIYFFRDESEGETKDLGLIQGHPLDFLGAHLQVLGLLFLALGDGLRGSRATKFHLLIDFILTLLIIFPLAIIIIGWFLAVIPCQFLVYLICGAPSRLFQTSNKTTLVTSITPSTDNKESSQKKSFTLDIKTKPFEFSNAIAALVLFFLSQILF